MRKNIVNSEPTFLLIIILLGFPQLHEALFAPSLQHVMQTFSVSVNSAQNTISIYFLAFACGVLFWGTYSDSHGRRPAMMYGLSIYLIGASLIFIAPNFTLFLMGRAILAFGIATTSVTTQTILREAFSPDVRNQLFSKVSVGLAFVPGLGPILGGFIVEHYTLYSLLALLVVLGLSILVLAYNKLPETRIQDDLPKNNVFKVFTRLVRTLTVWIYGFFIAVMNAVMSCYYAEAPIILQAFFNRSLTEIGSYSVFFAISTILGALLTQRLLKHYKPERIMLIGNIVFGLGSLTMVFASHNPSLVFYIGGMIVVRFGTAISLSNAISLALNGFEDVYGTAGSLFSLGYYLCISLLVRIMATLHTGSMLLMPRYFLVLASTLIVLSIYTLKSKKS